MSALSLDAVPLCVGTGMRRPQQASAPKPSTTPGHGEGGTFSLRCGQLSISAQVSSCCKVEVFPQRPTPVLLVCHTMFHLALSMSAASSGVEGKCAGEPQATAQIVLSALKLLLYNTVSYCTVLYWKLTVLYCTVLYCTVLDTIPCCTVLYCTVLCCAVLHRDVLHWLSCAVLCCT